MTNIWFLAFMFSGQPMISGPHELEVCLYVAQQKSSGEFKAHCYNQQTRERQYPRIENAAAAADDVRVNPRPRQRGAPHCQERP
jgi:hypothetical protein